MPSSLLKNDKVFLLLFLNALLVILGYAAAKATEFASATPMKAFRMLLLLGSILYVLSQKDALPSLKAIKNKKLITFLIIITPAFVLSSKELGTSIGRTVTFLIPLAYIWLSIGLLSLRYGQKETLKLLSSMILIIYAVPMLSYIAFGGEFSGDSIYGDQEDQVFLSNHFGWSAALFLISNFHLKNSVRKRGSVFKIVMLLFILLAIYLLIVSGNRASWLAMALSLTVILFYYKGIPLYKKLLIVLSPIVLFSFLIIQKNDAVMFVIERTERKTKAGNEGRLERLDHILNRLSDEPSLWLTGVGLFNYDGFSKEGKGISNYHNSYFEILFGMGIPLFVLYMIFMLFEPAKQFIQRVSKYDLLIIPLVIIPFFESNITAGQFLFFPWFSYVFAFNAKKKFSFFGTRNWFHFVDPEKFGMNSKQSQINESAA